MRNGIPGWRRQPSPASEQRGNSNWQDISWDRAGLELETEPRVGELSSSSEEDEGLKDIVAETWWALVQVDALTGPSGCSKMSKLFLNVSVLTRGEKETGNVC